MACYAVTAHYATWSGDMRSCHLLIAADSHPDALDRAKRTLMADRRRKVMGKLDMTCTEEKDT